MKNFFVLTGGPGAGKTAVLNVLQQRGYHCEQEVARAIIQQQQASGGDALPWRNTTRYQQMMMEGSIESYQQALQQGSSVCFFDRGLPDAIGYAQIIDMPISKEMDSIANSHRYSERVFVFAPWKAIYRTDDERKQNWDEVLQSYEAIKQIYKHYYYQLVEVPTGTPEARADFILQLLV